MIKVIDNALTDPTGVRTLGLNAEYIDWKGPDGDVYKRVSIQDIPSIRQLIEGVYGTVDIHGMAFRLNYQDEQPNATIHSDMGWGTHALVYFLCDGIGGTAFWQHKKSSAYRIAPGDLELFEQVKDDWDTEDAWNLKATVDLKFNRALMYESELFHSRHPAAAFGSSPEDGRLILVAFFTPQNIIRRATILDIPRITEMSEAFYETTDYSKYIPLDLDDVFNIASSLINTGVMMVAVVDGEVVGMIGLAVIPFMFNTAFKGAHEVVFWVEPSARRTGVGVELNRAIEPICKELGVKPIVMAELETSHPHVASMYKLLGYNRSEISHTKVI